MLASRANTGTVRKKRRGTESLGELSKARARRISVYARSAARSDSRERSWFRTGSCCRRGWRTRVGARGRPACAGIDGIEGRQVLPVLIPGVREAEDRVYRAGFRFRIAG